MLNRYPGNTGPWPACSLSSYSCLVHGGRSYSPAPLQWWERCWPRHCLGRGGYPALVAAVFGTIASGSEEMDARGRALVGRHWYHTGFVHFPLTMSWQDTVTPYPQLFIRKQVPKGQGAKHDLAGSKAGPCQPRPEQGRLGAPQSPACQASSWWWGRSEDKPGSLSTGPGWTESTANQGTVVVELKGGTPTVLFRWGLTPLCLQDLHSIKATQYMQCWF